MGQYPLIEVFMAQRGLITNFANSKLNISNNQLLSFATKPSVNKTRDELIAYFGDPYGGTGKQTRWDVIKGMQMRGGYGAKIDPWGMKQFNTFDEWKNWFIQQHPTNEIVTNYQYKGIQPTTTQPTTTTPTMNQSLVNQPITSQLEGIGTIQPIKSMTNTIMPLPPGFEYNSWLTNYKKKYNLNL